MFWGMGEGGAYSRLGAQNYYFFFWGGGGWVGTYSRLGAYSLFLPKGWALIRGGRLFEVGRLIE